MHCFGNDHTREPVNEETIGTLTEKLGSGDVCALMDMYHQPRNSMYLLYKDEQGYDFIIYG